MRIYSNLTANQFKDLTKEKQPYHNMNEMIGDLHMVTDQLQDSLKRGNGQVTSEVLKVLVDLANIPLTASRSYIH
jgi:hypothetical protein